MGFYQMPKILFFSIGFWERAREKKKNSIEISILLCIVLHIYFLWPLIPSSETDVDVNIQRFYLNIHIYEMSNGKRTFKPHSDNVTQQKNAINANNLPCYGMWIWSVWELW